MGLAAGDRIWEVEGRVGGWVRVFVFREKLDRWMSARWMAQIAFNLVIRVKAAPRVSLAGCFAIEFLKI